MSEQQTVAQSNFAYVGVGDDENDLPRTLRREREAQARQAREREAAVNEPMLGVPEVSGNPRSRASPFDDGHLSETFGPDQSAPPLATVARLDIPFFHLMMFFLKAVLAAVPALIALLALLWLFGEILTATFPELIKMQVLIRMPN